MRNSVTSLLLMFSLATVPSLTSAQSSATPTPEIFSPGIISGPGNDGTPTFTPDGNTIYFTRSGATWTVIMESHRMGDHWSEPVIAPFSGEWSDMQPVLSADGSYLIFASLRPAATPAAPSTAGAGPARVAALWRVDRKGSGWSDPVRLPDTVNANPRIFKPTIANDGSLYFFMQDEKSKKFRLFRSQMSGGTYQKAEPLSFSDGTTGDVDPEIAGDESFLIFSSDGRNVADTSHEQMYVVFKSDGKWGPVTALPYVGSKENGGSNDNEAHISRDGSLIYFASDRTLTVPIPRTRAQTKESLKRLIWDDGNYNVWTIPAAACLNKAKAVAAMPHS
jgi:Tol biopolymer transport system component